MIVAATKTFGVETIKEAIACGITDIGENKVQELNEKYPHLKDEVNFHFIGHLQTNKVKYVIDKVKLIHSLDRVKLAEEINKRAKQKGLIMDCLVEINIGGEESKYGIPPEEMNNFIKEIEKYDNIKIKGLMTIAPYLPSEEVRPYFKKMKELFDRLKEIKQHNVEAQFLSMGMSNDYCVAVEEGANIVRIGTSIFGARLYNMEG
ncbi:alanine racemase domain-containing protein [Thermoanaerobacter kivui]|uniref:Pyridoxal phosphate homeostasis protein n=1 Tax=Thermoanaerobacter kivui TaxID=2325 RepID=A0A097AS63_THEKI|nr:alanine racemase domain-containing protein [Thermoanaerobacter kivui]